MIDADAIRYLAAFAVILATAMIALIGGTRTPPKPHAESATGPAVDVASGADALSATASQAAAAPAVPGNGRPRIFTGEPAHPEPRHPPARRAARLVGGVAVLAAAGAIALIAFVRAIMLMIQRIGD
jgi:hypothetical protein